MIYVRHGISDHVPIRPSGRDRSRICMPDHGRRAIGGWTYRPVGQSFQPPVAYGSLSPIPSLRKPFFSYNLYKLSTTRHRVSTRSPHRPSVHRNQQFPSGTAPSVVYGGPQPHFGADLLRQQEDYGSHHRGPAHVITMGSMNVALCGLFFFGARPVASSEWPGAQCGSCA